MTIRTRTRRPSLEDLFVEHHRQLVRLATVLTGDPELAADVAQDAFVRLGTRPGWRWPAVGTELAYLRRTVVNLVHSHHRHLRVVRRRPPDRPGVMDDASVHAVRQDDHQRLLAVIKTLPGRQRDCVVLRYFADLNDAEIAEVLGINPGTVKSHLHRARAALAAVLPDEEMRT